MWSLPHCSLCLGSPLLKVPMHLVIHTHMQAKKFVEGLPSDVKNGVSREEADKLAAALTAAGGVVEIV